jgi:uncharacterized protein (DUF1800 family)
MNTHLPPRIIVLLVASGTVMACTTAVRRPVPSVETVAPPVASAVDPDARTVHVLNRLAFGPRPGEVEQVMRMGVDRWIDRQLRPESIDDSSGTRALNGCPLWTDPVESSLAAIAAPVTIVITQPNGTMLNARVGPGIPFSVLTRDSARAAGPLSPVYLANGQLLGCRLARVEASEQQLLEVMTDFWENHFSIYSGKVPGRGAVIEWDRAIIRPNALGRFRTLLGEVAYSATMLMYLDNAASRVDSSHVSLAEYIRATATGASPVAGARQGGGLNENYGRELLELHTLGVDGGYTQADVIEVARAFTGWGFAFTSPASQPNLMIAVQPAYFYFDSTRHDADTKVVLGRALPAGRGMEDGDDVLDLLARHPSTARFIARKLAVRFVSDVPPDALVDRAAATFTRTDGDIREVVRTIVTSPEFQSPEVFRAKVKAPVELVLSMRRALAAPVDTAAEEIDLLVNLEQPPFGRVSPDGWPEVGSAWMNVGALRARVALATKVARGEVPSIPVESWPEWKRLSAATFDKQLDGVIRSLLGGRVSEQTRAVMARARPPAAESATQSIRELALRELIALALSSPEFQRR